MSSQIVRMPSIEIDPDDPMEKLPRPAVRLHIVHMLGQPSGMGSHLTARLPVRNVSVPCAQFRVRRITPDLIHEADFELNVLSGQNVDINPTPYIHTRIYAARPDVTCIYAMRSMSRR